MVYKSKVPSLTSFHDTICIKLLFSLDDYSIKQIKRKVWRWGNWERCKKCGFEMDLSTAGTHESDNGCVQVYAEADGFVCPMCSSDSKSDQGALQLYYIYLNEAGSSSVHHINIHLYHF